MTTPVRFVQIAVVEAEEGQCLIYGLDDQGCMWMGYDDVDDPQWTRVPMPRSRRLAKEKARQS
jgi:hypothetical protein